ncbi:PXA domain-containing protein [Coniochaeta sp. 2T2.1]|nr:PXA domain-containing protein [Coniochaeta sp. 2T2.1]
MTTGATAPPRVPTPRVTKAPPTSSLSSESVAGSNTTSTTTTTPIVPSSATTPTSRAGTPAPHAPSQPGARRGPRPVAADPLSDRATAALIRRVLCPEQQLDKGRDTSTPIEELLPPLTSRNDVDLQLYALIAIILREYVQKWYNKITPDETFVAETVQIIAHCTRALEQRLRNVDLESLVFDEIPDLLDKHVNTYRASHCQAAQPPVHTDPHEIYHSMWPLPALSPVPKPAAPTAIAEQAENETAYRQLLVQGVLALLLPTEDLENDCLTALVGQVFSELIIGNIVANRLAEPWLVWECLIILSSVIRRRGDPSVQPSTRAGTNSRPTTARRSFSFHGLILALLQCCFLAANFVRFAVATVVSSRSIPPRARYGSYAGEVTGQKTAGLATDPAGPLGTPGEPLKIPVLAFRMWPAISNLFEMDMRMPWLSGTLSFLQWIAITGPGRAADVDGVLDRYLSVSLIQTHLLDAATLPPLLRTIRGALFPNNAPGVSTLKPPSSETELVALRRRCASSLWALIPRPLGNIYFGRTSWPWSSVPVAQQHAPWPRPGLFSPSDPPVTSSSSSSPRSGPKGGCIATSTRDALVPQTARSPVGQGGGTEEQHDDPEEERILSEIETGVLDVFGDAYCNKHLMYAIVELVLVRLMPELAEKGVIDLLEDRLA